jgi:hypothetical protein
MCMRSRLAIFPVLAVALAASAFAQNHIDSRSTLHITFPEESPVAVVSADWGESNASARGGAMLLDLHTSLLLKNSGQKRIRGVTLLVMAQEVTPGGKASVSVPSLNVAAGETFPIRIDLRLLRPLQIGNGPLVEIGLDGVLYDDLSFYGSNRLNSRRSMTVWEMEARRDRKYFRGVLDSAGQQGLQEEMLTSIRKQRDRSSMEARVSQGAGHATNTAMQRPMVFAFLEMPNSPVQLSSGNVAIAGDEARMPKMTMANVSTRQIRAMEVGWMLKDARGKQFVAGSIPIEVSLAPKQSTTVVQDASFKFSQPNGQPINIEGLTGFVNSVEYADGNMWIPDRNQRMPNSSPEEQRLIEIYNKKGIHGLIEELKKF